MSNENTLSNRGGKVKRWAAIISLVLVAWFLALLVGDQVVRARVPVLLPNLTVRNLAHGTVTAEGAWETSAPSSIGVWSNSVRLECHERSKSCRMITTIYSDGVLLSNVDDLDVTQWDGVYVVAVQRYHCVTWRYTIDIAGKMVRALGQPTAPLPAGCDDFTQAVKASLVDGIQLTAEKKAEAQPWFMRVAVYPLKALFL